MLRQVDFPNLIKGIKTLADRRESNFLNDDEIKEIINETFLELYNDILNLRTGYFLKTVDDVTVSNGNEVHFPVDFYKVVLLEQKFGPDHYIPLSEKTLEEVSQVSNTYFSGYFNSVYGYVLYDDHLKLFPEEGVEGFKFRLNYGRDLNLDSDLIRNEFIKYLKYQVAYIYSAITQNPNAGLLQIAQSWRNGIIKWASMRDFSPKQIKDFESAYARYF